MIDLERPRVSWIEFRDAPDFSGAIVRTDGRLCLVAGGKGYTIQLQPAAMLELAQRLVEVAALVQADQRACVLEATDDLNRLTANPDA